MAANTGLLVAFIITLVFLIILITYNIIHGLAIRQNDEVEGVLRGVVKADCFIRKGMEKIIGEPEYGYTVDTCAMLE